MSPSWVSLHGHSSRLGPALARWLGERGAKGAACLLCSCTQPQHPPPRLWQTGWTWAVPCLSHVLTCIILNPPTSSSLDCFNPSSNITTGPSNRWILYMKEDFTYSKFQMLLFPSFHCKKPFLKTNVSCTDGARGTEKSQMLPGCF